MSPKRKGPVEKPAPRLYTLTERQADWLRRAAETEGGAFCGLTAGPEPRELVDGGAAEYREHSTQEHRAAWAGHWEAGMYTRTEYYLVPTPRGLELLAEDRARKEAERDRAEKRRRNPYM